MITSDSIFSFIDDLTERAEKIIPIIGDKNQPSDVSPTGASRTTPSPSVVTAGFSNLPTGFSNLPTPVLIIGGVIALAAVALAVKEIAD